MRRLLLALQLLTRVPVRVRGEISGRDLGAATAFFPVVGALQGLAVAGAAGLLLRIYPPPVAGALAVAILALSNGGLHLDGLADTFDALGMKASGDAGRDRERRLAVMRDSTTGAIGTIAIVLTILLKSLLIGALFSGRPDAASYGVLFLMPVGSKWAMVVALHHGAPARAEGLGRAFSEHCTRGALACALGLGLVLFGAATGAWGRGFPGGIAAVFGLVFFGGFYLFSRVFGRVCAGMFGGISGDTVGAMGEISELLYLMAAGPWLRPSI